MVIASHVKIDLLYSYNILYRYIMEQVVQRKLPLVEKAWIILTVVYVPLLYPQLKFRSIQLRQ